MRPLVVPDNATYRHAVDRPGRVTMPRVSSQSLRTVARVPLCQFIRMRRTVARSAVPRVTHHGRTRGARALARVHRCSRTGRTSCRSETHRPRVHLRSAAPLTHRPRVARRTRAPSGRFSAHLPAPATVTVRLDHGAPRALARVTTAGAAAVVLVVPARPLSWPLVLVAAVVLVLVLVPAPAAVPARPLSWCQHRPPWCSCQHGRSRGAAARARGASTAVLVPFSRPIGGRSDSRPP